MKTVWRKQPKKYELRWAKFPQTGTLSGIVPLYEKGAYQGHVSVRFDPSFVQAVGKHMPIGIGPEHPAYLVLDHDEQYRVWCKYLRDEGAVLLWEQEEKPEWLRGVKQ